MAVASLIGVESNNPEGGLNQDAKNDDIIECIVDIANGFPYSLGIDMDSLTEYQRHRIVESFLQGANE